MSIARTDDVSTVFRGERQTVIAVDRSAAGTGAAPSVEGTVQSRFVGLLATNAYRVSVLDIPGVGAAVADALDLSPARMHTHTGRATRTVLENLPRDLVLELEPTALARLVASIVGLQERQLVRAFEVAEPVGPWVTVLVYLPRGRFTAELPDQVADAVAHAYEADRRTFETDVGASSLARIAVSVRSAERRRVVDLDALERTIDELSTSWSDGLRAALVAEVGEERARTLFETVGAHAPVAYVAAVGPDRAIGDIRRIADLLAAGGDLTTSLGRDVDAPAGEWRFRVYRRGAPAALSELLPLLDHLGLQALDERPYTFRLAADRVYVYDIGVRIAAGTDLDEPRRAALQEAFIELVDGRVESDGFNRLVLLAGLSVREVALRAGVRQVPAPDRVRVQPDVHRAHPEQPTRSRRRPRRAVPPALRPGPVRRCGERRADGGRRRRRRRRDGDARRHPEPRRRPHLPCLPDVDHGDGAHELLPRPPGDRAQAGPGGDPGAAAAEAEARDLGVWPTCRGCPPARQRHRPRRPALERPAGGLPHRGARPDEGPDGEERGDRAERRQGRLRRQAPARGASTSCAARWSSATGRSSAACST